MTNALANLNTITPNVAPLALFIARHGGEVDLDGYTDYVGRGRYAVEFVVKLSLPVAFTGVYTEVEIEGKGDTPTEAILHALRMGGARWSAHLVRIYVDPRPWPW